MRLTGPGGVPTNVPFLFGNILRRLIKDYQPDYIGIVFDPPGATFRDKLFEKYKAQRQPMPDEMRVQLPFVKRLCEAMRLPILEVKGYEADDVIGTMAVKAAKQNMEVLIISNDKDMMQLVGKNVRTLRTGSGGLKADIIVDEKKVEEILGVTPEQVVDYMALLGDTIDNIPGRERNWRKRRGGADQEIRKRGESAGPCGRSAEQAISRSAAAAARASDDVEAAWRRLRSDAPVEIKPAGAGAAAAKYGGAGGALSRAGIQFAAAGIGNGSFGAGFAPAESEAPLKKDYAQFADVKEFRAWLEKLPAKAPLAVWLQSGSRRARSRKDLARACRELKFRAKRAKGAPSGPMKRAKH